MRRTRLAAAALCLLATAATAQPLPALRIALADDADALDPTQSRTLVGRIVFSSLCDKLFDIDANLNIIPQLAASHEWADSRTLLIRLRPGVTFHDGTKLDANAVKFSMERHLTMQGSTRRGEISALDHVEIVDPLTVRMVLKAPNSPFVSLLADRAGMIVPPTSGADFAQHPVCNGPFKFVERIPQDRIVLDRYPGYWNAGAIKLSRVTFRPIIDNTVRLANLQAGSLDIAERFEPSDLETIRKDARLKAVTFDGLGYTDLLFNIANGTRPRTKMMQDARIRRAFTLSIDRDAMNQVVFAGLQTPIAQAVPPSSPFYDPTVTPPPRDLARAKSLLAEAGVTGRIQVELLLPNGPVLRQMGEVIQSMAAEAGFDVKLRTTEFVTALKASDEGDYEIFLIGWSGRVDADGNLYNGIRSKGPLNASGYSNPEADSLLEQARLETAIPARRSLYGKLARRLLEDVPIMYLWTPKTIMGMTAKLSGYQPIPDGLIRPQGLVLAP